MHAISDPNEAPDPAYAESLRAAAEAAIEYGLAAAESGEEGAPPVPPVLLGQARIAARNGFSLDTVLRRYFAGYALLSDQFIEAANAVGLHGSALQQLVRGHAVRFDRLLALVSEEYAREAEGPPASSEQRRRERIECLLDGELLDISGLAAELAYEFEMLHIGLVAIGDRVDEHVRGLSKTFDCRALIVLREEDEVWAWLGARRDLDCARIKSAVEQDSFTAAIGEKARGLAGWRLTHRQARAALPVVLRGPENTVRYSEVALLASMLRDDLLLRSMRDLYLAPLEGGRAGGEIARQTLRAYFAADRNVSSTAAALGMSRNAVTSRLQAIEEILGVSLGDKASDLEMALRLDELEKSSRDSSWAARPVPT